MVVARGLKDLEESQFLDTYSKATKVSVTPIVKSPISSILYYVL
jgi:hypothetical protein